MKEGKLAFPHSACISQVPGTLMIAQGPSGGTFSSPTNGWNNQAPFKIMRLRDELVASTGSFPQDSGKEKSVAWLQDPAR